MKNEDRIAELLAEMLRKQDRHEEVIHSQSEILKSHSTFLKELVEGQQELIRQFHRMNDHLLTKQEKMEDRISRLEDKVFKG